jgi:hypothetical protein
VGFGDYSEIDGTLFGTTESTGERIDSVSFLVLEMQFHNIGTTPPPALVHIRRKVAGMRDDRLTKQIARYFRPTCYNIALRKELSLVCAKTLYRSSASALPFFTCCCAITLCPYLSRTLLLSAQPTHRIPSHPILCQRVSLCPVFCPHPPSAA